MFAIWRFALSVLAAIAFGLAVMVRRWGVAAVASVVLVAAIMALSIIVTVNQIKEYRGERSDRTEAAQEPQLSPSGLPAAAPAPRQPGVVQDGHPTGAAAPSPQEHRGAR